MHFKSVLNRLVRIFVYISSGIDTSNQFLKLTLDYVLARLNSLEKLAYLLTLCSQMHPRSEKHLLAGARA